MMNYVLSAAPYNIGHDHEVFNSSSVSKFEDPFHRKIQNLTMSSIFNMDHHGMKEICILSFSAENWGKVWFFG